MRRAAPLFLPFLALLAGPMGGDILQGQSALEEVTRIHFEGNERFSDKILETAIITRETACRSPILLPFCWTGMDFSEDPYYLHSREFSSDLLRLYRFYIQRGYRETAIDTSTVRPKPGEVEVTFRIREGDPVRVVDLAFQGDEPPDTVLLRELPAEIGQPLSALVLEATRDTLTARLRDRGFAHADVLLNYSIPRDAPLEATVVYDLYMGPPARFGPISVMGNVKTSEGVVHRMLPLTEGRPYSETLLLDGQRNLYNLDIFTFADITPVLDHLPDSIVPIMVRVTEGDVHRVRAGAGFSTAECINTEARWASRNFLGGARRLQVTGQVSNVLAPLFQQTLCPEAGTGEYGELNWLLSADFTQPWLRSPRTSLSASVIAERESLPDVFVREALGFNIGLTHALQPSMSLTFAYRPGISQLDAAEVFFCSTYLLCTPEDIGALQGTNWLAPFGLRFAQDRRNQALSPTRGHAVVLDVEHADGWTGSDFPYTRILGEGSWHTQGRSRRVFGAKLKAGWVVPGGFRGFASAVEDNEIVHPEKRLFAGGSNSVRGYAQNRLGPQVLYVEDVEKLLNPPRTAAPAPCTPGEVMDLTCDASSAPSKAFLPRPSGGSSLLEGSVEFRLPIAGQLLEGAAFLDFGQVWENPTGVNLTDLEFTPGLGVRYFSPIGPIRIDLAYRFNPGDRLKVVTSQIRPFDPGMGDDPADRLMVDGQPIDFVVSDDLALLGPQVWWGDEDPWSLSRFQLHLTIGQAF
jgi:outer membrane protein insertion porin family